MSLQFHQNILFAEGTNKSRERLPCFIHAAAFQRSGKRPFITAGQTDQTGRVLFQLAKGCNAVPFGLLRELVLRNEQRKILVAPLRFTKEREPDRSFWNDVRLPHGRLDLMAEGIHRDLRTDVRADAKFLRVHVEPR